MKYPGMILFSGALLCVGMGAFSINATENRSPAKIVYEIAHRKNPADIPQLVFWVDHSDDPAVRQAAIVALGVIGNDLAVKTVTEYMNSDDPDIRKKVVEALDVSRNLQALPALAVLSGDDAPAVSERAVKALNVMLKNPTIQMIPLLTNIIQNDNAPAVAKVKALAAAKEIGSGKFESAVIEACDAGQNEVCAAALDTLGEVGRKKAVELLTDYVQNDDDEMIAAHALRASGALLARFLRLLNPSQTQPADADQEDGTDIDEAFVESLTELAAGITTAIRNDNDIIRLAAVQAAGEGKIGTAVPALIDVLKQESGDIRNAAYESLKHISGKRLPADPIAWSVWYQHNKNSVVDYKNAFGLDTSANPSKHKWSRAIRGDEIFKIIFSIAAVLLVIFIIVRLIKKPKPQEPQIRKRVTKSIQ